MADITIYAASVFSLSVCASSSMSIEEVLVDVERQHPCGTEKGWTKSEDTHFAGGQPNPCPCNSNPEERQHWLLDA